MLTVPVLSVTLYVSVGIVSTLVDYDVDENNMAANVVMVMTVSDQGGETATSTLTVRFVDCNDNAPEWTVGIVHPSVHTAVHRCTLFLGQCTAAYCTSQRAHGCTPLYTASRTVHSGALYIPAYTRLYTAVHCF